MTIRMRDAGGTLRIIKNIRMRDAAGVLRIIKRVRIRDAGNVLRTVFVGMSSVVSPSVVSGSRGDVSIGNITTSTATALVSGGTGPYTYSWALVSGDPFITWGADSPTTAATTFTAVSVPAATFTEATFEVTITDSDSPANVSTATVRATAENTNTS